jgi:hypothetical protein
MFEKLAKNIINKKVRIFLHHTKRQTQFVTYQHAKSFFILFESDASGQNAAILQLIQELKRDGKLVTAWGYEPTKGKDQSVHTEIKSIFRNDFDLLQRPSAEILTQLQQQHFDVLIDISSHHYIALDYLILNAPVIFRTGIKKADPSLFDFAIEIPESSITEKGETEDNKALNNYNQLIFYLKNIQSKDY